jgi:hypothetical protein
MVIDAEKNIINFDTSIATENDRKGFVGPFRVLKNFQAPYEWKSCNASTSSSGATVTMATATSWWIGSGSNKTLVWHVMAVISATVLAMW